jgi:hypothetical protein
VIECSIVSVICVRIYLNVPAKSGYNLSDFDIAFAVHGVRFPTRALLALIVRNLTNVCVKLVDRQLRALSAA